MTPAIIKVEPKENYTLKLYFENGELRLFDVKPYLHIGIFRELQEVEIFNTVEINFDTIIWKNEADIDPEVLYNQGIVIK